MRNTGERAGTEVVQLYLSDPAGLTRVPLAPGAAARVTFRPHADRTSFTGVSPLTGRAGGRIVEPGVIGVSVGGTSSNLPLTGSFTLTGPTREAGLDRILVTPVSVKKLTD